MRSLLLAALATVAAALLIPSAAAACTCYPNSIQWEFEHSDVVFRGVVTSNSFVELEGMPLLLVTFDPSECWKGDVPQAAALFTCANEAACGYPFQVGVEYLVFASGTKVPYSTSLCSLTRQWVGGGQWIAGQIGDPVCTVAVEGKTWSGVKRLFD